MVRALISGSLGADLNLGNNVFSPAIRDLIIERSMTGLPTRLVDTDRERGIAVDVIVPPGAFIQFTYDVDDDGDDVVADEETISEAEIEEVVNRMRSMANEKGQIVCFGLAKAMADRDSMSA